MSDEPYAFGPIDPRTQAVPPTGRPDLPDGTEARAWGSAPGARPIAAPAAGVPGVAVPGNATPGGAPAPWGAQPPVEGRGRMSTVAKSLTAVGVAAVIAIGGTVAVTSANADNGAAAPAGMQPMGGGGYGATGGTGTDGIGTGGSTGTDGIGTGGSTGTGGTAGTGRSGGFGGGMSSRSLVAGALHGEFVVADGTGTVTERLQTGAITSISSSSVTVKSTDDFAATYAIPAGIDISSLVTGSTVTVIAKVNGSTATVVSITAAMQGGTSGTGGGFTPPDGSGSGTSGAGGTGSGTGSDTGGSGSGGPGTSPGGNAPGGSATGTPGEDSGV